MALFPRPGLAAVAVTAAVLSYTTIETLVFAFITAVAVVALVALVVGVIANRRLDRHLSETQAEAVTVRSSVTALRESLQEGVAPTGPGGATGG